MITLYIVLSYLVMAGMMISNYEKLSHIKVDGLVIFIFSPIVLPITIGMMIGDK